MNRKSEEKSSRYTDNDFHIVGIGCSAGGLDSMIEFFEELPPDTGMAYIVVSHLSPDYKSNLSEILSKHTEMTVTEIEDGMKVMPDTVYVIAPDRDLIIRNKKLLYRKPEKRKGLKHPIDRFFRSLALNEEERSVGIVMSGMGSEGTLGIKEIKGHNGLVIVQDPETASFNSMPSSALDTGMADFVLAPGRMPAELINFTNTFPGNLYKEHAENTSSVNRENIDRITNIINYGTGHDFSMYKENTLVRRIKRRMSILDIPDINDFIKHLEENKAEMEAMLRDFLIEVTSFFRDPEAFEAIKKEYLPGIIENKSNDDPLRIWVPACSTGEEAYSLAMMCKEYMMENGRNVPTQIFATDIGAEFIDIARRGRYPETIDQHVNRDRLEKFFVKEDGHYHIKKMIREMIVFAQHNVTANPPFSNLDIVSCRNLLIYLSPSLQKKLFQIFHYSLNQEGILLLGTSESTGQCKDLFKILDEKLKIFRKRQVNRRIKIPSTFHSARKNKMDRKSTEGASPGKEQHINRFIKAFKNEILDKYSPPVALIEDTGNILYIKGNLEKYLRIPSGRARVNNIFEMAKDGLKRRLNALVREAVDNKNDVSRKVDLDIDGEIRNIELIIIPYFRPHPLAGLMTVTFTDQKTPAKQQAPPERKNAAEYDEYRLRELEKELEFTKKNLSATISDLEMANEELTSMNEEFQSTNEEMQSANEELETSQEELKSLNEELNVTNRELKVKIDEVYEANNDLRNLFRNAEIAVLFLDKKLRIRRFSSKTSKLMNLIKSDEGRPFKNISTNLTGADIVEDSKKVLKNLEYKIKEVKDEKGNWYHMKIMPYRTREDSIGGVAVTLFDITRRKEMEETAKLNSDRFRKFFEGQQNYCYILSEDGKILDVNSSALEALKYEKEELVGEPAEKIYPPESKLRVEKLLSEWSKTGKIRNEELTIISKNGQERIVLLNADRIKDSAGNIYFLFVQNDETERRKAQEVLKRNRDELKKLVDKKSEELISAHIEIENEKRLASLGTLSATIAHELRNPLATVEVSAFNIRKKTRNKEIHKKLDKISKKITEASVIIDNLLNFSNIKSPVLKDISIGGVLEKSVSALEDAFPQYGITVNINIQEIKGLIIDADPVQLDNVFRNILLNSYQAVMHEKGQIEIKGYRAEDKVMIEISDDGPGIDKEVMKKVFEPFFTTKTKGTGLGLSISNEFMKLHGGEIKIDSREGEGTAVKVIIPYNEKEV
ncbi:MAG: chemotaxis protein CheB [Candidatus Krumholzibacteriota bacterium]|nr:chemotaxis protein CheB [Candidatus Krumholzibacteriota bacterium]